MKGESHRQLGRFLMNAYLPGLAKRHARAFLLGCIEPDRNPTTYLKGSVRSQWLRGHNWNNASRYMGRICARLERKERLSMLDYYAMGKLMHYTADAFTYAHNKYFPTNLKEHRRYEIDFQACFLAYLHTHDRQEVLWRGSVMGAIRYFHADYVCRPAGPENDALFATQACCTAMSLLTEPGKHALPAAI